MRPHGNGGDVDDKGQVRSSLGVTSSRVTRAIRLGRPDELPDLQRVRARVYVEEGFLDPAQLACGRDVDIDDSRSLHLALVEAASGDLVGTSRLIFRQGQPLPVETQVGVFLDAVNPVEISRLAILSEHRSFSLSIAMWKAVFDVAVANDVDCGFALVEAPLLRQLRSIGLPFEVVGPSVNVYNTINTPVRCVTDEVVPHLRERREDLARFFAEAEGDYASTLVQV